MLNVGWPSVFGRLLSLSAVRGFPKKDSTADRRAPCRLAAAAADSVSFEAIDFLRQAQGPNHPMFRRRLHSCLTLAFVCTLIAMPCTAERISRSPGAFPILAESLIDADPGLRWEFADTMLDVLLEAYGNELRDASRETVSSAKRASKLRRWRRAMQELVDRLIAVRLRLTEGAEAVIHVDAQHQVFLFVDSQPVAFSAPRPGTEQHMEDRIVTRFCAFHDCRILEGLESAERAMQSAPVGSWAMQEERPPAYEIDGELRCEFARLSERQRKQRACEQAAEEAKLLLDSLIEAQRKGYRIDWQAVADGGSTGDGDFTLRVTASGDFLHLPIAHLARLPIEDWQAIARWLRARIKQQPIMLIIEHGDTLIDDSGRG